MRLWTPNLSKLSFLTKQILYKSMQQQIYMTKQLHTEIEVQDEKIQLVKIQTLVRKGSLHKSTRIAPAMLYVYQVMVSNAYIVLSMLSEPTFR